jgi:hypothetical protein
MMVSLTQNYIIFIDDASLHLSGYVNGQGNMYWSSINPRQTSEIPYTFGRMVYDVSLLTHE